MKEVNVEYVELMENGEKKKLHDEIMDMPDMDDEEFEKLADKHDRMIEEEEAQERVLDKFDELIEKHEQREREMQKAYDDYIASQEKKDDWEDKIYPKKQITVKLFPNTHKKLKVMATSKDTTLEKIATSIVEDKIGSMDIIKYVTDEFELAEEFANYRIGVDYSIAQYGSELMDDHSKADYDRYATVLKIGKPRKRVNVKVYSDTHMKLKIMAAIQDRSLNNIVSSIIEDEIGEPNGIDFTELSEAIIKYENIDVEDVDIEQIKDKFNLD